VVAAEQQVFTILFYYAPVSPEDIQMTGFKDSTEAWSKTTPLVWEEQWGRVVGRSHENGHGMPGSGNRGAIGLPAGGDW
jgi:hypothetical protein